MQQPGYLEVLRERYRFGEWSDAAVTPTTRVQLPTFSGSELPGWRLVRQTRREAPGHPPFLRSMWQGDSPEQLVGIEIYECASPAAAREYLLQRLGEFQAPMPLARDIVRGVGDVAFALPGETVILFARGNAVVVLHNAGRRVEALGSVARAVDALLAGERRSR